MATTRMTATAQVGAAEGEPLSDDSFQGRLLQGVSRTFALTIPQLPGRLARVVSNGYLLCRIVDTIEDEPALTPAQKQLFCERFIEVVSGRTPAAPFAAELAPLLSGHTLPAERELIRRTARVIAISHSFNAVQREALESCVAIMSSGMAEFQQRNSTAGLAHLREMDRYCYHVAGVVGEMLTKLFCEYSPEIAQRRGDLMALAISFGQGLQMTNILKDLWDDRTRGACWLPRDVFASTGVDLRGLTPGRDTAAFGEGLGRLIAVAHWHLRNAMEYTLLIPARETGIRNFCLWAIGMALLTLRKINKHRDFIAGNQVKISRRSVKATIIASRLSAGHDHVLRSLFYLAGRGLPAAVPHAAGRA